MFWINRTPHILWKTIQTKTASIPIKKSVNTQNHKNFISITEYQKQKQQ